jgi:hypothetical protein
MQPNIDKKGLHIAKSFSNVKTLLVDIGLTEDISWCLQLGDGELPPELLPELQKLRYSGIRSAGDVFTSFIAARRDAGRPITLFLPSYFVVGVFRLSWIYSPS